MTTKEMIEVLQAFENGAEIEYRNKNENNWQVPILIKQNSTPLWNFGEFDYRIKKEPKFKPFANKWELVEAIQKHGLLIVNKDRHKHDICCIKEFNDKNVWFGNGTMLESYYYLFNNYIFIDDAPFGKLE